ncbi:MAG: DUF4422 domain-containing protein [Synergistaceae bacterium]|nr:DUF4422 domain-containing protein [Synergistaceae bacterium]
MLSEIDNSILKILICYHKPYALPDLTGNVFLPIHVGKALSSVTLDMQTDNEVNGQPCDNISSKNDSYCELTAIYWAWKNLKKLYPDVKYVGLFHYRRFFAFHEKKFLCEEINKPENAIPDYRIDLQEIINILDRKDIILGQKIVTPYPMYVYYSKDHMGEDYKALRKIIKNEFSDYYEAFMSFWEFNNKYSARNMFIMRYDDFVKYCEWLFAVLASLEKVVPYTNYNTYQKRVFGFIAERLLNVYVMKNNMRVKYLNVYHYDDENDKKKYAWKSSFWKNLYGNVFYALRNMLSFRIFMFDPRIIAYRLLGRKDKLYYEE